MLVLGVRFGSAFSKIAPRPPKAGHVSAVSAQLRSSLGSTDMSSVSMPKQAHSSVAPRLCIFCSNSANSPEHIWPKWMGAHFQPSPHDTSIAIAEQFHPPTAPIHMSRHGHPTTLKLKVVCRGCNNGWMSEIEAAAKPYLERMLLGQRTSLDDIAQLHIARWLTLKMMVFERNDPSSAVFTRTQTVAFAENKSPPDYMKIWLFWTHDPYPRINRGFTSLFKTMPKTVRESLSANTQTFLLGAGRLLAYAENSHLPAVQIHRVSKVFGKPLWPPRGRELVWPPMRALPGNRAMELGASLRRFLERPGMIPMQ